MKARAEFHMILREKALVGYLRNVSQPLLSNILATAQENFAKFCKHSQEKVLKEPVFSSVEKHLPREIMQNIWSERLSQNSEKNTYAIVAFSIESLFIGHFPKKRLRTAVFL